MRAWTETSSAEVGSSSTTSLGSSARARAMAMRWHWPPLNSCERRHRCCVPRPTISSSERTRASSSRPLSATARGAARRPGRGRSCAGSATSRGPGTPPGRRASPCGAGACQGRRGPGRGTGSCPTVGLTSWRTARAAVDLPHPDSPTSASVSPSVIANETSSTACTVSIDFLPRPRRMWKWTVRSSTCSRLTTPPRGRAPRRPDRSPRSTRPSGGRPPARAAAWRWDTRRARACSADGSDSRWAE